MSKEMNGTIKEILICENSGDELFNIKEALLIEGKGIKGDRYYSKTGTFSKALEEKGDFEVTLIEKEEIDIFNEETKNIYSPGAFRRNLVTSGIRLNELVEKNFTVGEALLFGVRYCEPCSYLAGRLGDSIMSNMVHKAGLRAIIKQSGKVSEGCAIGRC